MTDQPPPVAASAEPPASGPTPKIEAENVLSVPFLVAAVTGIGFLGSLAILAFHDLPKDSHDIIVAMTGVLGTAFTNLNGFYFGSSSSSQKKDETINKLSQ